MQGEEGGKAETAAEGEEPAAGEEPGEKPEAPAAAEPEPEAVADAKAPEAEQPAAETPETAAAAQPAEGETQELTPEQVQERYTEWRGETEEVLAKGHYNLDEDTIAQLQTEPEVVIPQIASRVYLDAVTMAIGQVQQMMPRLFEQHMSRSSEHQQNEDRFFGEWPQLKDKPEHRATVQRLGKAYRASNPTATAEQFIRDVGVQAMISLKLPIEEKAEAAIETPAKAPFQPAQTQPGSTAQQPKTGFAAVDEELFPEDDGVDAD